MATQSSPGINKTYFIAVSVMTFVIPIAGAVIESAVRPGTAISFVLIGKWFIFSAVGLRLFLAGVRQTTKPAFTAKQIFDIEGDDVLPVVRELGFANLCFGLIGIVSVFLPSWRVVSACGSGLYYGIAGVQHLIKKPVGANELFALITDLLIFIFLLIYFLATI